MLIISKEHDYYDTVGKTAGVDKSIVYKRNSQVFYHMGHGHLLSRCADEKVSYAEPLIIGFCGKNYTGLEVRYRGIFRGVKCVVQPSTRFFYGEEALEMYDRLNPNQKYAHFFNRTGRKRWWEGSFSLELYRKYNTPILMKREETLTINPVLRTVNFQSQVDPYTAFQEIQMFLSGVLGNTEGELVEVSDRDRLEGHGFDNKWSFRQPENRKSRKRKKK